MPDIRRNHHFAFSHAIPKNIDIKPFNPGDKLHLRRDFTFSGYFQLCHGNHPQKTIKPRVFCASPKPLVLK
jgi:hypothetical protein